MDHEQRHVAPKRLSELDSIRGIAALVVLVSHMYSILPADAQGAIGLLDTPFRVLALGRPAVILFFVLSGFVLALSLEPGKTGYPAFLVRRFFRIYVPFAFSIVLALVLYWAIGPSAVPEASAWFSRDNWSVYPSPQIIAGHFAMIGWPDYARLNNPMWSLVVEVRWSLFFPALFALLWCRRRLGLAAAAGSLLLTELLGRTTGLTTEPYYNRSLVQVVTFTAYFMSFFVVGLVLARERSRVAGLLERAGPIARGMLWIAALALLSVLNDVPNGIGAALLLSLAMTSPTARHVLSAPVLRWLGRISYSLYLTHVIVLVAMVHALHGTAPLPLILLSGALLSMVVAHFIHQWVEMPSVALGRRLMPRHGAQPALVAAP